MIDVGTLEPHSPPPPTWPDCNGLSTCHISTSHTAQGLPRYSDEKPPHIRMATDGGRIVASVGTHKRRTPTPKMAQEMATREAIAGFSFKSRRNLMSMMRDLRQTVVPLFVTLTYPAGDGIEVPDGITVQGHLDMFRHRLLRRHPSASAVWKREYTKRGVPHVHLLVFGINTDSYARLKREREAIACDWADAVDSDNAAHRKAGTSVELPRLAAAVGGYVGKYVWKNGGDVDNNRHDGRWWGAWNRTRLPWAALTSRPVPVRVVRRIMRYLRRHAGLRTWSSSPTVSAFTDAPEQWQRLIDYEITQWLSEAGGA